MRTIKHFISYYKPYRFVFFVDLLCASIISIIDILFPLILDFCSTQVFVKDTDSLKHTLLFVAAGLVLMYAVRSLCRYYVSAQGHIMGARMESDMRKDLFEQYQKLSFSYYDTHNTGVMMSRVTSDLFDISEFAHHGPENLFISLVKVLGSFVIMFVINWKLAFALLIITVFLFVFSMNQNKRMKQVFMDNRKKIGEVNASLQDSLAGIRVVKSFANEERERQKFGHSNQRYLDSKIDNYMVMGWYYGGTSFLQGLLYVTVIVCGGFLIAQGQMSAIQLATFALYINVYVAPLEILIEFTEMFQKGFSGFKRFEEVIDEIPEIKEAPDAKPLDHVKGMIDFEDVSFSYENNETVLDHVDIHIPAGKKVALVGPSGGGKTTLCSLIPRFYDVSSGAIRIDGQNIKDVTVHSLRKAIGLVQQDVYLFGGTIRENIGYGKEDATDEEIAEAARKANIHDFIMTLPDGYDSYVGERGTRLSGGQKQRISIARVFLKDPKILILDEATSALDNESERVIQNALDELARNRTCITIAHRLSTIKNADEIIVIDDEGIKERGTHETLLAKNGIYANYYRLQFKDPDQ
ncbi:ABC transporter ATP-binding protein [uncultured Dubosiella sp.]|uniref:ABC transporter ATP-binding protein n=3 Tax=uncultured Dubosiella sp. TaxID=1937011 RepID=UPI002088F5DF|nr:ABC transporter ATP-binding protein [uncultured Dubosiella sp.]GJM57414.1 thiamine ABC transporter permease [Erysipelotrichaceae bacterium OPF54]